jgi:hypothetical protein
LISLLGSQDPPANIIIMPSPIKLVPLFALGTLAGTAVQSIFFFASTNTNAYVGSVVATTSGLTTYNIACTSGPPLARPERAYVLYLPSLFPSHP